MFGFGKKVKPQVEVKPQVTTVPLAWTDEEKAILRKNKSLTTTELAKLLPRRSNAAINCQRINLCGHVRAQNKKVKKVNPTITTKVIKKQNIKTVSVGKKRGVKTAEEYRLENRELKAKIKEVSLTVEKLSRLVK